MSWPTAVRSSHPFLPPSSASSSSRASFSDDRDSNHGADLDVRMVPASGHESADSALDSVLCSPISTDAPSSALARLGVGHSKRVKLLDFHCGLCDVRANDAVSFQNHFRSARHRHFQLQDARAHEPVQRLRRPIRRWPELSAAAQLSRVISGLWYSFPEETVTAMFLLRTKRYYFLKDSQRLSSAQTVEHFAELVLAAPVLITAAVPLVRAHLACTDLPEHGSAPLLVLPPDARRRLQLDCLFRALQRTALRLCPRLLLMAATRAIEDGTAEALLSDHDGTLLFEFAHVIWSGAHIPGSAFHWAWHDSLPPRTGLARSLSVDDTSHLSERPMSCMCFIDDAELTLLREEQRQRQRDFEQLLSWDA